MFPLPGRVVVYKIALTGKSGSWISLASDQTDRLSCRARYGTSPLVCCIKPPDAENGPMINHIIASIDNMLQQHPYAGVVQCREISIIRSKKSLRDYPLKQIIIGPTRCRATLDKIFTNTRPNDLWANRHPECCVIWHKRCHSTSGEQQIYNESPHKSHSPCQQQQKWQNLVIKLTHQLQLADIWADWRRRSEGHALYNNCIATLLGNTSISARLFSRAVSRHTSDN